MTNSTEIDDSAPPGPSAELENKSDPSGSEVVLWSYLPAILVDVVVTVAVFLLAEGMLLLANSYVASISVLLLPVLTIAGRPVSISSVVAVFLPLWLLASVIAIVVRHTVDILRARPSRKPPS